MALVKQFDLLLPLNLTHTPTPAFVHQADKESDEDEHN